MKLQLGFESHPYISRYRATSPLAKSVKSRRPHRMTRSQRGYGEGKTTLEVAQDLENRYKIVETFWELEQDKFIELLEEALADDIEETVTLNKVSRKGISVKETDKIEAKFRENLSTRRYDGIIPGTPTKAAQRGVSHLDQHPFAKRAERPSFIDTGMYRASFRAWVEDLDSDE